MKLLESIAFWRRPKTTYEFRPEKQLEPKLEPKPELKPDKNHSHEIIELREEVKTLKSENEKLIAAQTKLLEWVKTTHRLSRAPDGIRAMIQKGKRIVPMLLVLLTVTELLAQAPPVIRQPLTTNFHFGPVPTEGQVPTWNTTAMKWSNNIPAGGVSFASIVWTNDTALSEVRLIPSTSSNMVTLAKPNFSGTNRALTISGYHTSASSTNSLVEIIGGQPKLSGSVNLLLKAGAFDDLNGFQVRNDGSVDIAGVLNMTYGQQLNVLNSNGSPGVEIRPGGDALQNCFVGFAAGGSHRGSTGHHNAIFGTSAGATLKRGSFNTIIGQAAGETMSTNAIDHNTFVGQAAGFWCATNLNTFVGSGSGTLVSNGSRNTFVGAATGSGLTNGEYNTFIGVGSGFSAKSNSMCVFLGAQSGTWETAGETLMIDNTQRINESDARTNALIYGLFNPTRLTQRLSFHAGLVSQPGSLGYLNLGESTLAGYVGMGMSATKTAPNISGVSFVSDGNTIHMGYITQIRVNASGSTKLSVGAGGTDGFLGVGMSTETPGSLLSVGSGSRFQVNSVGIAKILTAGASVSNVFIGGTLHMRTTSSTNFSADGTFTNLSNVIIPAHTLTNAIDMIRADWGGKMADATANTNNFQIVYGSQTILDTGLNIASNCAFRAWVEITRTGNTAQHAEAHLEWGPGGGVPFGYTNVNIEITQTNGINTTLALRGAARRLFAHTNNFMRVQYFPAL